jgi:aspartate/methionine/tyrosine aminotransferase
VPFHTFELERWQSTWENLVRVNLSESGVHPLSLSELLEITGADLDAILALRMVYNQSDGSETLRAAIAALYDGATTDHVTVTVGSSEANFVSCWTLIEPGDRVAIMTPTYWQTYGLAKNFGATVSEFRLDPERGWEPVSADIAEAIAPGTKLVVVTQPNNPTGHILSPDARDAIVARAQEVGAWILADEVYQGAEHSGPATPSLWSGYDRTIVVNGLSKAYGLPGLRIGWIVSSPAFKEQVVRRHDYTVIGPTPLSDHLATLALRSRDRILARTRGILNANYPLLRDWMGQFEPLFDWQAPECGAICFARYRHPTPSLDFVERARREHDILLVPGEHFGLQRYIRFGFGNERDELQSALDTLTPVFAAMRD